MSVSPGWWRGLRAAGLAVLGAVMLAALPARAVPPEYFGLHIHHLGKGTNWPEPGPGSLRAWDARVTWADVQPSRDQFDFSRLDLYVQTARQKGVPVLLPLAHSPRWASSRPDEPSPYGPGRVAPPARIQDWRNYVEAVVRRYQGRIEAYDIWNEPSDKVHYSGTLEQMVELTCEAHRIIRAIDPKALVVSPATAGGGRHVDYLGQFLAAGGRKCIDVVAHHLYVFQQPPEAIVPLIRQVRAVMRHNGVGHLPLWNTESGWWLEDTDGTPVPEMVRTGWVRLDGPTGAAWLMRALVLGRAEQLGRFYWYSLDNRHGLGMLQITSREPKPALAAFGQIQAWLREREVLSCRALPPDVWTCELADARRRVVADLLWTTGISAPLSRLPAATRAGWQHCQLPGESAVPATALADRMLHPTPMLCMRRPDTVAR